MKLDDTDEKTVNTFRLILSRDHGCMTPLESFIDSIVLAYQYQTASPKFLRKLFNEFELDFADAVKHARVLMLQNPQLFEEPARATLAEIERRSRQLERMPALPITVPIPEKLGPQTSQSAAHSHQQLPTKKAASPKGRKAVR